MMMMMMMSHHFTEVLKKGAQLGVSGGTGQLLGVVTVDVVDAVSKPSVWKINQFRSKFIEAVLGRQVDERRQQDAAVI